MAAFQRLPGVCLLGITLIWGLPRARWARAESGPAALRECLDAVDDRTWAVRECLARLAPDAASQAALIDYGLAETARQCRSAAEPGGRGADAGAAREVRNVFRGMGLLTCSAMYSLDSCRAMYFLASAACVLCLSHYADC